jgi:hypothetical protein
MRPAYPAERVNRRGGLASAVSAEAACARFHKASPRKGGGLRPELKLLAARGEPGGLFTLTGHAGKR